MADEGKARIGNIALLIDADNASPKRFADVLAILADLGNVNIRRAYANWEKPLKGWKDLMPRYAIEPRQQFDVVKGKSATDMRMIIEAMDLLHGDKVDGFGLMTSDSDFMPLAMRLREDGLAVYGFGSTKTPESFRQACTRFIDLEQLTQNEEAEAPAAPPVPKATNAAEQSRQELLTTLVAAIKASKQDEDGYARLSEVGSRLNAASSFDVRTYGYSALSKLIKAMPEFRTEQRGEHLYLKRVR